jgi:transcriptional regulator with XRE-family HTH domain
MNYFSENLKYLRGVKKVSQYALADALNIKRSSISSWEEGRAYPNYDTIIIIAKYFSISLDDLISAKMSAGMSAGINAGINAGISGQKSPPGNKGSFKQSLNTGPPPGENQACEKCQEKDRSILEKDRTIEAQRTTIYTQQELIKSLKDKIQELAQSSGQKRKAG